MAKITYRKPAQPKPAPTSAADCGTGLVIGFIHPGTMSAYFTTSLVASLLVDQNGPRRLVGMLQEWSSANVSGSRNSIVRQFLDGPGDWLLFVDADMAWEPGDIDVILSAADPETAPIVGGLCFGLAHGSVFPTIYGVGTDEHGDQRLMRGCLYEPDTVMQVAATGAAFLLVHRSVYAKVRDDGYNQTFPWFQETEDRGQPVGEDVTFCLRAARSGFPVPVHTGVRIGHHKSQVLTEALFIHQQQTGAPRDGSE